MLQLGGLARPLCAEKDHRRVGRHHRTLLGAQQVARILGREDKRPVVLADSPRQADDKTPDRGVLEKQAQLVDHEHAAAVFAFDPSPQRLRQQEVDGSHHLVAQLAHAEDHDW